MALPRKIEYGGGWSKARHYQMPVMNGLIKKSKSFSVGSQAKISGLSEQDRHVAALGLFLPAVVPPISSSAITRTTERD
jgi:hypothetical protein